MRIFTEVVGGPNDGDLVQVDSDTYIAVDFSMLNITSNWLDIISPDINAKLKEIQYRRSKAFFIFNNKYYTREFFVCKSSDQDKAIKSFRDYFNPVFKK